VPGIDAIDPAQFDLSADLGISGQFSHPGFVVAIKKSQKSRKHVSSPLGNVGLQSHKLTRFSPRLEVTEGAVFCHPAKLIARPARLNQFCSDSAGLTHPPSCKVAPRMCWAQSTQATLPHMQINLLT
jgi:hypothetical protein